MCTTVVQATPFQTSSNITTSLLYFKIERGRGFVEGVGGGGVGGGGGDTCFLQT